MPQPNPIADQLLAARVRSGLTQEELARRSGVSRCTINDTERRVSLPSCRSLGKLAAVLGVAFVIAGHQ